MLKIVSLLCLVCLSLVAGGQTQTKNKDVVIKEEKLVYDTSKIAILPFDPIITRIYSKAIKKQTSLSNDDLETIDKLLNECIKEYNSKQDTTTEFNWIIDLHKYRLQYMAIMDSHGDRKVYVNGFCGFGFPVDFSEWKKQLLMVSDGGNCFFHVTINLSKKEYEELMVNGVA